MNKTTNSTAAAGAASFTRRLFLRGTVAASVGTAITAPVVAEPAVAASPDDRITAAIDEIVSALREKWPNAPIRIVDYDNVTSGMVMVLTHIEGDKPGSTLIDRKGTTRRSAT